ncbi:alpha/beta hydrolase [Rhodococcus zopfii]
MTVPTRARPFTRSFHPVGLAFALLFFVWSMTPSLLPRAWYLQGVATGISMVTGYGIGCLVAWILRRCGVQPDWSPRTRRIGWWVLAGVAAVVIPTFLILGSWWQQIVRDLVTMERVERSLYLPVLLIALAVALLLLLIGRGLRAGTNKLTRFVDRYTPTPVARVTALVVVVVLLVVLVNGALYRGILGTAEEAFEAADAGTAEGVQQPAAPERSGSPESGEAWDTLGQEGRTFVAGGPDAAQIEAVTGRPALEPIRAYAGRESAETMEGIAERVVAELKRTGAFDRKALAVVTTTGRGWVNGSVAASFEYLNGGDSAIAAMQYSYLPSPLAFIADRESPMEAGRALFEAVYAVWIDLPEDARPKLVVFGESLGSYGGQSAFASGADLVARTDGALLVGTPNFAQPWGRITEQRDPGSLERLPIVDEGRNIRFAATPDDADLPEAWEFPRIVFWQHGSDPITWWSFDLLLHQPDWLREPLGPDVDPGMRWIPFVTFWQVTLDMVFSAEVPAGFGHSYGPEAADLWADILAPEGWTQADTDAVRAALGG